MRVAGGKVAFEQVLVGEQTFSICRAKRGIGRVRRDPWIVQALCIAATA